MTVPHVQDEDVRGVEMKNGPRSMQARVRSQYHEIDIPSGVGSYVGTDVKYGRSKSREMMYPCLAMASAANVGHVGDQIDLTLDNDDKSGLTCPLYSCLARGWEN